MVGGRQSLQLRQERERATLLAWPPLLQAPECSNYKARASPVNLL